MCARYSISPVSEVCAARTWALLRVDEHEIIMRIEIIIGEERWTLMSRRNEKSDDIFRVFERKETVHFCPRNLRRINFKLLSRRTRLVSSILVANYLRNAAVENISTALARCSKPLFPVRHFAEIMALSLGRCHSRASEIVPLITAVRADKQWRRTMAAARSTTMDFVVFSNPRRDAHRPPRRMRFTLYSDILTN